MLKLGVIGTPLSHSLSPVMHNAALKALGVDGEYEAIETEQEDIISRLKYLRAYGYKGFNVTIPLKVVIIPFLNSVDDYANVAGAVNTVIIDEQRDLQGYNTDVYGFINAIPKDLRNNLKDKDAAVLGSGGAARAVAVGLAEMGLKEILFYARNEYKAENLKGILNKAYPDVKIKIRKFNEYADLEGKSILVNTTPVGMKNYYHSGSPVKKRAIESLPQDAIVYDLVYNPNETEILKFAKEQNLIAINGVDMLVLQGAKALSLWLNQEVPIDIMKQAVLENL